MPTSAPAPIGHNTPPPLDVLLKDKHATIFDKSKKWVSKAKRANLQPQTVQDCEKLEELFGEGRDIANDANGIREAEKKPYLEAGTTIDGLFNGEIRDAIGAKQGSKGLADSIRQAAADRRLAITREAQRQAQIASEAAREQADKLADKAKAQEDKGQVRQADVTHAQVDAVDRKADQLAAQAAAPVAEASRARTGGGRSVSVNAKLTCTGVVRDDLDLEKLRPYFKQEHMVDAVNAALKIKAFEELKGASIQEQAIGRIR